MIRYMIHLVGLAMMLTLPFLMTQAQTAPSTDNQAEILKSIKSAKNKLELNSIWRKIIAENPQYKDDRSLIHAAYVAKNALMLTQAGFFEESLHALENNPIQPVASFPFSYEFNAIMILNHDWAISRRAMEGYRNVYLQEISNLTYKPESVSKESYIAEMESELAKMDDRMANMYYHTGELDKARIFIEKSIQQSAKVPHVNELYIKLLPPEDKNKQRQELERFVIEGAYTPTMKTMLEELHSGKDGSFETYFSQLETAALKKVKTTLAKKLIKEKAPLFKLKNLEGKEVSLSDYRGKTVVLDFWATWCGPCIMSFPTMTKARDLFIEEGKNVVFLFVDTGEKDKTFEIIQPKVVKLLEEKPYKLDVLFDLDNSVQQAYKISGLPTKLFIDPKGQIRYKSTGFDFDQKKAIIEMRTLIELIQ